MLIMPINEKGSLALSAAIIMKAVEDVDILYKKIESIRKKCQENTINQYLFHLKEKNETHLLPFKNQYDHTALDFFDKTNKWGATLLDGVGIELLPAQLISKLNTMQKYRQYCLGCILTKERVVAKKIKNAQIQDFC